MDSFFKKITFGSIVILLTISSFSFAKGPKILDLGRIEIEGEVRSPPIKVLDTSESVKKIVKELKVNELGNFEKQMIRPAEFERNRSNKKEKN